MKVKHGAFIESEITKVEFPGQGFSSGWIPITAKRAGATTSNIVSKAFCRWTDKQGDEKFIAFPRVVQVSFELI